VFHSASSARKQGPDLLSDRLQLAPRNLARIVPEADIVRQRARARRALHRPVQGYNASPAPPVLLRCLLLTAFCLLFFTAGSSCGCRGAPLRCSRGRAVKVLPYSGKFMRRRRSWKRGSECRGSNLGSALRKTSSSARSSKAFCSHAKA